MMMQQADYVICLWDEAAARGGGTQAELTTAKHNGIRVYVVTEIPAAGICGWILACTDRLFGKFEELKKFLASTYGKEASKRCGSRPRSRTALRQAVEYLNPILRNA